MKQIFVTCFFITAVFFSYATSYYVDTTGSDNNAGTSAGAPWKTITKVNQSFASLAPGDHLLFKCGQTFYGSIILTRSGTPERKIIIGAYGSGNKPVISGFTKVPGFIKSGINLWQSPAIHDANIPNMVTFAGIAAPMGRYPDSGYLPIHSSVANSSITDNNLTRTLNWTGAEIVIRKSHWILSRDIITDHSDGTITYKGISGYSSKNGYGYFIQNSVLTLSAQNEWYFNNSTKKLTVFSSTEPSKVMVASKDTLLYIGQYDHITVDGIAFEGANVAGICIGSLNNQARNDVIKNCDVNFSGRDAIYGINNTNCSIISCTINHSWNNAILLGNSGGRSLHSIISNNIIKNIGYAAGMGYMNAGASYNTSYSGISISGDNSLIQYNTIDTVGYIPINYYYDSSKVKYNKVNFYCFVKDDGAGIYTWTGYSGTPQYVGRQVIGNIILNGIGAGNGTGDGANAAQGIYLDDGTTGVIVDSNGIYNMAYSGIYVHNTCNAAITNNLVYNCKVTQLLIIHDNASPHSPIRNLVLQNNQFIARDSVPVVIIETVRNDVDSFSLTPGAVNNNYYFRPINDDLTIKVTQRVNGKRTTNNYALSTWKKTYASYDVNSTKAPVTFEKTITSKNIDNYVRFEYAAGNPVTVLLGAHKYQNITRTNFTGNYKIPVYRPVILFKKGTIVNARKKSFKPGP